jgi:hypothetical protein
MEAIDNTCRFRNASLQAAIDFIGVRASELNKPLPKQQSSDDGALARARSYVHSEMTLMDHVDCLA